MNRLREWLRKSGATGLAALGGVLWYKGGEGQKALRRVGVAIIIALIAAYKIGWGLDLMWALVAGIAAYASYTIGYGIPDSTDPGSSIGQFWDHVFPWQTHADELMIAVRATTGFFYGWAYVIMGYALGHEFKGWLFLLASTLVIPLITYFRLDVKKEGGLIGSVLVALALLI